jgi:hypothetical protein
MGHDATIVINMDAVDQIQKDPEFGKKVYDACCTIAGSRRSPVSISSGGYHSAAVAVDCHHADWHQVMIIGGRGAIICNAGTNWQQDETDEDVQLRALKSLADSLGYRVSKKPSKKLKTQDTELREDIDIEIHSAF